jgi:hypothetical protein
LGGFSIYQWACEVAGVAPGIAFGKGLDHCNELIGKGFRFIGVGGDMGFLVSGTREAVGKIRR